MKHRAQQSFFFLLKRANFPLLVTIIFVFAVLFSCATYVLASATSNFTMVINSNSLSVDIVDNSYVTVGSPSVSMNAATMSFSCQTVTGTFGTSTQQIYIRNPDAADSGWTVSLAASDPTDLWDSAGTDFDFNDSGSSGCTDGGDTDSFAGQMTVDPSVTTLATAQCESCTTSNITKGTSSSFEEGVTDSITILSGSEASDDIGAWKLTGISISQTLPAEQPAASDYNINLTLSITAS